MFFEDGSMQEKTWCYWEKGKGEWDELIFKEWRKGTFIDNSSKLDLEMGDYRYKMIRSRDFIERLSHDISIDPHAEIRNEKVVKIDPERSKVYTEEAEYTAKLIFDSRFLLEELEESDEPMVLQHFKGRFVKSKQDIFDPDSFCMMDFRNGLEDLCSFVYILPFSKKEALIEYTLFSPQLLEADQYDQLLDQYITEHYPRTEIEIESTEFGVIPMSSAALYHKNKAGYFRIGTAGSWVKASSGYSFKHAEKKSALIAKNLVKGLRADHGIYKKRSRYYDKIFLSVLENENQLGNTLFQEMYRKNKASLIFKFLDEESSLWEDLKIILRFNSAPFTRALIREI